MNLSKIVSKLPSTKKYKLICSPNNFYNLSLKSRYPKNIYAAQNIDLHGKGASTGSIDIEDLVNNKIKYCILGHSEVRSNFGETDLIVQKKKQIYV
jgi:triosephosphate isomerase